MIYKLKGHSGANVFLYKNEIVFKVNYKKAEESAKILEELPINTPKVYYSENNTLIMEYLNGEDMITYLSSPSKKRVDKLIDFCINYFDYCLDNSVEYNFYNEVLEKLEKISLGLNGIKIDKVIDYIKRNNRLSILPRSIIHGDFTLDNIIYYKDDFYLIDANPTELNSIVFDANKLLQDLDKYWFLFRSNNLDNRGIKLVCNKISKILKERYNFLKEKWYLDFMLCRILPYCTDLNTINFLHKNIKE